MARTPEADLLTEQHRIEQVRISTATALLMMRLWVILREDDLDRTTPEWLAAVLQAIRHQRREHAELAADYARVFRRLELGPGVEIFVPNVAAQINEEQVIRSMMVTGPVAIRDQQRKIAESRYGSKATDFENNRLPVNVSRRIAELQAAAALRHARNGERETLDNVVREDKRARGHVRVTSGHPCFWCAMLASRGPVYSDDSFANSDLRFTGPGEHKVHDGCGCGLEVVYYEDTKWPGRAREFDDLWRSSTAGKSGRDAVNSFRRAYDEVERTSRRSAR